MKARSSASTTAGQELPLDERLRETLFWDILRLVGATALMVNEAEQHASPYDEEVREEGRYTVRSWHDAPIKLSAGYALALIVSAGDHLLALAQLVSGDPPSHFAIDSVARGAVEAAARCFWITQPDIGPEKRIARLMTELLYSNHEQAKLMRPFGGASQITVPSDEILAAARELGFTIVGNEEPFAVMKGRASTTDVVARSVGQERGRFIYQALSAGTHATVWSLLGRMAVVMATGAQASESTHSMLIHSCLAVESTCDVYVSAAASLAEWQGLDTNRWTDEVQHVAASIAETVLAAQ